MKGLVVPSHIRPIRNRKRHLLRFGGKIGRPGRARGACSPTLRNRPKDCRGEIRFFANVQIPVLVNRTFTKGPLGQRTRFFVAERRSSLPGRGALVLLTKAPLFSLRPAATEPLGTWYLTGVIRAHTAQRAGADVSRRRKTARGASHRLRTVTLHCRSTHEAQATCRALRSAGSLLRRELPGHWRAPARFAPTSCATSQAAGGGVISVCR